jgi:RNA polymerase sigma factor (sigma-70 family)
MYDSAHTSVTEWIESLKQGRDLAATRLWDHFLQRLTRLVSDRLRTARRTVSDEEDVIVDTCEACFRALQEGRYPDVRNRDDLWKLLAVIAERKAIDQIRRSKKGIDGFRIETPFIAASHDSSICDGLQQLPCTDPTPEFAVIFAENFRTLLEKLDDHLANVALLKMQGYTNQELAERIGRSVPTVERNLRLIRETWSNE